MNCLEFRRRLSANPEDRDADIRAHTRDCASCTRWAAESTQFESLLRQAMEVEVPENLASRILLRHALRDPQRNASRRRGFALAASILVTVLLGGALLWFESKPTLADEIFAHMDEMPYSLTSTKILDDESVASVFRWFGADVSPELGNVSFANVCEFKSKRVAHVVLQRATSPVTVIIMPGERVTLPGHITSGKRSGLLLPYAGGGMVIVPERAQRLDELEERIRNTVRWPKLASEKNIVRS